MISDVCLYVVRRCYGQLECVIVTSLYWFLYIIVVKSIGMYYRTLLSNAMIKPALRLSALTLRQCSVAVASISLRLLHAIRIIWSWYPYIDMFLFLFLCYIPNTCPGGYYSSTRECRSRKWAPLITIGFVYSPWFIMFTAILYTILRYFLTSVHC